MSKKYESFEAHTSVFGQECFVCKGGESMLLTIRGLSVWVSKQQAMDFFGLVEPNANALILRLCTGCKQEHPIDEMREWNNSRFVCVGCDEPIGGGG